jgi:isopropylmalate/homocitrate/citramalate synthase
MVGTRQRIEIGFMSGVSNVVHWLVEHGIEPADRLVQEILRAAKERDRVLTDDDVMQIVKFVAAEGEHPLAADSVATRKNELRKS